MRITQRPTKRYILYSNHHHHQITKLSHSINAIGPAPHRSGILYSNISSPAA
jgi:hypothetical protein